MIVLGRFNLLHEMCLKYPNTLKLWLGPTMLWVLVNEPRYIQKILLSPICLEKPFFYKFLRLDSGLISSKCKFFWCELSKPVFDFFSLSFSEFRWCLEDPPKIFKLFFQFKNPPNFHTNIYWKCKKARRKLVGKYWKDRRVWHAILHIQKCAEYDLRWVKELVCGVKSKLASF